MYTRVYLRVHVCVDLVLTSSTSLAEYSIHETKACCSIPLHKKSGKRLEQMNTKEHRLRGLAVALKEKESEKEKQNHDQIYGCLFNRAV